MSRSLPITPHYAAMLAQVPAEFKDSGLTLWPDSWLGFNMAWVGRLHDWRVCSRCHPEGSMTTEAKRRASGLRSWAAFELEDAVKAALPWRWRWIAWPMRVVVAAAPRYWDTCGYDSGELCRHNMKRPAWMKGTV